MFRNYLKIALRTLIKHWPITIINLGGLSLSIGIAILILLYVRNEFSFDKFNEKRDRIYLVSKGTVEHMPSAAGIDLKENILEIEEAVRFTLWGSGLVEYPLSGEQTQSFILQNPIYSDSTIFDIFSFNFISGDPNTALNSPFSVVITQDIAKLIFDEENPLGKVIRVENSLEYTITGVIKNVKNFHISIDAICSFSSLTEVYGPEFNYRYDDGWQHPTYVLLPEKHNITQVEGKINQFYKDRKIFDDPDFHLVSLNKLYFTNKVGQKGNLQFVFIFLVIAILIIVIASLNYINLSTAGSAVRSAEIGVKKVFGARKIQLLIQLLTESIILLLFALALGFLIAELLLPAFNNMIFKNLEVNSFYRFPTIIYFILGIIALAILSGLYPAFNLIAIHPTSILKRERTTGKKGINFRRLLILFQFTVSTILLTGTLTVFRQMTFIKQENLGFVKGNTIVIKPLRALEGSEIAFRDEMLAIPDVLNLSYSCNPPGGNFWYWTVSANEITSSIRVNAIDPEFVGMYGLKIIEGRDFDWNLLTDKDNKFILNKTAVNLFGLKDPIGKILKDGPNGDGQIIGVVEDFHFISLHHEIQPLVLYWLDWPLRVINIRLSGHNKENTLERIEETWKNFSSHFPFSYSFLDESFDNQYKSEDQLFKMFGYFTILALLIACSGLFGLSLFLIERKTKEIGIRRVFGASVGNIIFSFTIETVVLIGISILLAGSVSWFYIKDWMNNFPFQTKLTWWLFFLPGIITVILAVSTIIIRTLQAARMNPADSLRYE